MVMVTGVAIRRGHRKGMEQTLKLSTRRRERPQNTVLVSPFLKQGSS